MPKPNTGPRLKSIDGRPNLYIVWFERGRERVKSTGTTERRQAEAALAKFLQQSEREHRDGPRDPSEVRLNEVLSLYSDEHAPHAADPGRIGYAIDALLPFWGEKTVSQITKKACRDYVKRRNRAPGTVRRELGTLTAALNFAASEKLIEKQAVPYVELPAKPDGKDRWLARAEAAALLNASRTGRADVRLYLPLFILIGLYTGARKGAILTLRWPQIDLEKERIDFHNKGGRRTNKQKPHIPIPRQLLLFLKLAHRRRMSDVGFVIHDRGRPIKDIGEGKHGSFGGAVKRAGLLDVTPHTLRHTRGTWSAMTGVDLYKLAGWMGHSYASTVELYAHHHPDFMEEAKAAAERK